MKRLLPTIFAVLIVIGISCFAFPRQETPAIPDLTPPPPSTKVENLFGSIDAVNEEEQVMQVLLPDGGLEEVIYTNQITPAHLGLLAKVSGERDLSNRRITAQKIELIDSPNLFITSPERNATVTSPLIVFGFGRVFEQTFSWRLKDSAGAVVGNGYAMTSARDLGQFGPFRLEIFLPALADKSFTLEIFEASARDGSELDLVSVPLNLLSNDTTTFDIYFSNTQLGSLNDCSRVYPVERTVAKTSAVGRAALLELLAGPTPTETSQGYLTQIPAGTRLNSLSITSDTAAADFFFPIHSIAGSCRVVAISEQINQTLLQFPTVNYVDILENGEFPVSLQP